LPPGPEIPEWVDNRELDPAVRSALRGLDPRNSERVAAHLVAAGSLLEEDPEAALAHARAARDRASRVAAVREAVGVAAYHAGDFAEAVREIRAYRRMSGDQGYRAVLADCERALGRADVALRLVAEALADQPDADETLELRMVEAGARRDLGEDAAARLVLESAFGGRPDPSALDAADPARVRLAAAYADLLQAQGQEELAGTWLAAIAAADPDNLTGAVDGPGMEFVDLEDEFDGDVDDTSAPAAESQHEVQASSDAADVSGAPEDVQELPEDTHGLGKSFDEEVEAEVAELLGEIEPPSADSSQGDDAEH
jgi:tetratricopeptide (TPR) repeat protein